MRIVATEKNYSQGGMNNTGNPMDVAVNGRGFFQVLMPDGSFAYTRDGSFKMSPEGELVTSSGYRVQPAISIPSAAQSVNIGADGVVSAKMADQAIPTQIGTLQLTDFVNPAGLQPRGENLLMESAASGPAQTSTPGPEWPRHPAAGLPRGVERQRGGRARDDDRNPARLRDEFQGDLHHRPDAAIRE